MLSCTYVTVWRAFATCFTLTKINLSEVIYFDKQNSNDGFVLLGCPRG